MGVALGSFLAYGGTVEAYLSQFDVEKHEMASVMGICGSLVGHFGVTWENFGATLGPLVSLGSHWGATLGHLGATLGHFGGTLG